MIFEFFLDLKKTNVQNLVKSLGTLQLTSCLVLFLNFETQKAILIPFLTKDFVGIDSMGSLEPTNLEENIMEHINF